MFLLDQNGSTPSSTATFKFSNVCPYLINIALDIEINDYISIGLKYMKEDSYGT